MIDKSKCIGCGSCVAVCPMGALKLGADGKADLDPSKCVKCGACEGTCPVNAIKIEY